MSWDHEMYQNFNNSYLQDILKGFTQNIIILLKVKPKNK